MRVIRHGLEKRDFDVSVLVDGESVLRRLRDDAPDVLIVDSEIRPMSGEELCRRIQGDFPERNVNTFVLTSGAEDEYASYASWFSSFSMMEKPVSLRRLLADIDKQMSDVAA